MKKHALLIGAAALALMLGSGIGNASETHSCSNTTHSCSASDNNSQTIEPILTRTSLAPIMTGQCAPACKDLGDANIQSMSLTAAGGNITAVITVKSKLIHNVNDVANIAPYSGQHVLAMFQTKDFEVDQIIGKDATGTGNVTWGPPGYLQDGFRWFLYYGWNATENRNLCGLGYYDPTGEIVPPVPVFFGQTFFIIGQPTANSVQDPTATCTLSNSDRTVTIRIPYLYKYADRTGLLARALTVVKPGETVYNASAFSWMDHEIGGPDPIGLLLGLTWYTDAVPTSSYRVGILGGDPNVGVFAGPKCFTNFVGPTGVGPVDGVVGPPGPCTIQNPLGTGFINDSYNFVAG